jgi:hypothetical protein
VCAQANRIEKDEDAGLDSVQCTLCSTGGLEYGIDWLATKSGKAAFSRMENVRYSHINMITQSVYGQGEFKNDLQYTHN